MNTTQVDSGESKINNGESFSDFKVAIDMNYENGFMIEFTTC